MEPRISVGQSACYRNSLLLGQNLSRCLHLRQWKKGLECSTGYSEVFRAYVEGLKGDQKKW